MAALLSPTCAPHDSIVFLRDHADSSTTVTSNGTDESDSQESTGSTRPPTPSITSGSSAVSTPVRHPAIPSDIALETSVLQSLPGNAVTDAKVLAQGETKLHVASDVDASSSVRGVLMVATIIFGCAAQAPFEILNSSDRGCAHLVCLFEHLFGIVVCFCSFAGPRKLGLGTHAGLAAGTIGYTQFQNAALATALPTLIFIVLKNGNLVANMLVGLIVLRRSYGLQEFLGVLCITGGITLTSVSGQPHSDTMQDAAGSALLGSLLLGCALLSRALSNCIQEITCSASLVQEVLYFRSLLGLPFVLLHWRRIYEHAVLWSSGGVSLDGFHWLGPWGLLAANVVFDHAARVSVTHLITRTSALTANLTLTLQRFTSFAISAIFLSREPVGLVIWLGAIAVVLGSVLYTMNFGFISTTEAKKSN